MIRTAVGIKALHFKSGPLYLVDRHLWRYPGMAAFKVDKHEAGARAGLFAHLLQIRIPVLDKTVGVCQKDRLNPLRNTWVGKLRLHHRQVSKT